MWLISPSILCVSPLQDGDGDKIETALDLVINNQVTIHSTPGPDVMTGHDGTDVFTWHFE